MPSIKLENLNFSFEKKKAKTVVLNDVSIEFESNKIHVILGQSGCGKTTLLKCINGLYDYEGHIYFDDILMDQVPPKDRMIGYVSQEFGLFPHFSLFKSISYPLLISGTDADEIRRRTDEICEVLGIKELLSRKPKQVSLGEEQRAAIARALIKRPPICLFDEPLSNVDESSRAKIRAKIRDMIHEYNCTAIYVTHDLSEATSIADYIYLLGKGGFIAKGTAKEMVESNKSEVKEFFDTLKNETL
ncbi:MAG: ATP-binding cassette domain-containing protein [Bacilli bacterium]|nr:ATP-binding cassette domain-containing protein [Bacilli bacterium]